MFQGGYEDILDETPFKFIAKRLTKEQMTSSKRDNSDVLACKNSRKRIGVFISQHFL